MRTMALGLAATVAVVGLLSGCADDPADAGGEGDKVPGRREAVQTLESTIDETVAEVFGELEATPDDSQAVGCFDETGAPAEGLVHVPYGFELVLPEDFDAPAALDAAARLWEDKGYEVETIAPDGDAPAVHATFDGYEFTLNLILYNGTATVGGTTPCIEAPLT